MQHRINVGGETGQTRTDGHETVALRYERGRFHLSRSVAVKQHRPKPSRLQQSDDLGMS